MGLLFHGVLLLLIAGSVTSSSSHSISATPACTDSESPCNLFDQCSDDDEISCPAGFRCSSCALKFLGSRCIRSSITDQFKLLNNSLPFNKYAYLGTHNSFAISGEPRHKGVPRLTFTNQEDTVTQQLNNGVRVLLLDVYDFEGDIWLCHSFNGKCHDYTAFELLTNTLKEVEAFLSTNPSEIVTIVLEDYVETPNGLTNVFTSSGLMKYWFPLSSMPQNGGDWPLVKDMITNNQRLVVFTSKEHKQATESIAYQWNFMVENQYGRDGMESGNCSNRAESAVLTDRTKSLVFVNHFRSIPIKQLACDDNSEELMDMLQTCYEAADNRWANFVAVDFYKRSDKGGAFAAVDKLNGELLCGCDDLHACLPGSSPGDCKGPPKVEEKKSKRKEKKLEKIELD